MAEGKLSAQLATLRKELKKHADEEKALLDVLAQVAAVEVTREALKASGIGKTINKLAGDEREAVKNAAEPILQRWKALSKAQKAGVPAKKSGELTKSQSCGSLFAPDESKSAGEPAAADAAPAPAGEKATAPANAGPPKPPPGCTPPPLLSLPSDPKRKRTCELVQELFKTEMEIHGKPVVQSIAAHIEEAMANKFGASTPGYKQKYRTLKTNLNLNKDLKRQLLSGELKAAKLVVMSDQELLSEDRKEEIKKDRDEHLDSMRQDWLDANRDEIMKAVGVNINGGMFTCGRCGSKKTTHYQKQTRSADEPMTVFIQCTQCPNRWRQ